MVKLEEVGGVVDSEEGVVLPLNVPNRKEVAPRKPRREGPRGAAQARDLFIPVFFFAYSLFTVHYSLFTICNTFNTP
jgi:hypothetical protein